MVVQEIRSMQRASVRKISGGKLLKVRVRSEGGVLEEVRITGDFFVSPEEAVDAIEGALRGVHVSRIGEVVKREAGSQGAVFLGFSLQDLVEMIEDCTG